VAELATDVLCCVELEGTMSHAALCYVDTTDFAVHVQRIGYGITLAHDMHV
jgi:hypothetical protein